METKPIVGSGKASRLPAGSTLEIAPGVQVPHPHAEVSLPGAGDPRSGETEAVTEYTKVELKQVDIDEEESKTEQVAVVTIGQKPLSEDVRVKQPGDRS